MRCNARRDLAENIAETLTRGARVLAQGRLKQRSYAEDGDKRTVIELEVDEIGPSLAYASAAVTKKAKGAVAGRTVQPRIIAGVVEPLDDDDQPPF